MSKEKYLEIGKIVNIHGVRGALKVEPWCDSPEQLCSLETLYYKKRDEYMPLTVRTASIHKNHVLIHFDGIDSIDEAMPLKNRVLFVDRDDLPLADDRVFIADIIGLDVFDERDGSRLGRLKSVDESPANDLFVVETPDGHEVLVPAVDEFIGHIDESGVYLLPIPGMFDTDGYVIDRDGSDTDDNNDTDSGDTDSDDTDSGGESR
ncbi:MAG TPA: ribosome maturation factor RimM [Firmicutes bacterium]|nr:ribosome maturation factor RimM [Bacillota bacterium]